MARETTAELDLEIHPATAERWQDLEELFGKRGAYGGCWCMYWRLPGSQWARQRGEGNRQALRQLMESGRVPGILAYAGGKAVGWCSVSPRTELGRLERSRTLKRIDEQPVWSIICFFVARPFRRQGLLVALIEAAVEHVRSQGGKVVEAYPLRRTGGSAMEKFMGLTPAFLAAGFEEVAQVSKSQSIVRCYL